MGEPSETLKLLFAIEQEIITRDLHRAEDDLVSIVDEIKSRLAIPSDAKTPEIEAQLAHLFMVQAHELCRQDAIAPEVRTFHAAVGAGQIAEYAAMVTAGRDYCGEWPEDYHDLNEKYEKFKRVLERVGDTVFVSALRRYHLNTQADLYECDRDTFEIQCEIGRRVTLETGDVGKIMDDYFRRKYGQAASEYILARVKQIRGNGS